MYVNTLKTNLQLRTCDLTPKVRERPVGDAGPDVEGWDSIEHGKTRDFLTVLGVLGGPS